MDGRGCCWLPQTHDQRARAVGALLMAHSTVLLVATGGQAVGFATALVALAVCGVLRAHATASLTPLHHAVLALGTGFMPLLLHVSTGLALNAQIAHTRRLLWDHTLESWDTAMLGFFFPKGQLALFADSNSALSPASVLGRLITEVLQCTYMTYYVWGNALLLFLLFETLRLPSHSHLALLPVRADDDEHNNNAGGGGGGGKGGAVQALPPSLHPVARKLHRMAVAWLACNLLVFLVNFVVPAMSPRLHLREWFHTPLEGLFLGKVFQGVIQSAAGADPNKPTSFGSFASGHVAMTWLAALMARRLGFRAYASVARVGAVLMTCAVLYLRYHYFSDVVAGLACVGVALWVDSGARDHRDDL